MHFGNLCAALGIPRDRIAAVLGIEQRLVDALDDGCATIGDPASRENAAWRLREATGRQDITADDVARAFEQDIRERPEGKALPAELVEWARVANKQLQADPYEFAERAGMAISPRTSADVRIRILDALEKRGALLSNATGMVGPVWVVGYLVRVAPPRRQA